MDDEVVSVRAVDELVWLLVAYSDVNFSVITVEYIEILPVVIGWTDDLSKIDVITFELWSEIDDSVMVLVVIICVDDNDNGREELSVELEILLIAVVGTWVRDEVVLISMEVVDECDVDDNDGYSLEIDTLSVPLAVFPLVLLEIAFVIAEINCAVDSSDSIDEVRSLWELNGVVIADPSDEMGSLFDTVTVSVENVFVCAIVESV